MYWRNQLRMRREVAWDWLRPYLHEYGVALAYDAGVIRGTAHNGDNHGRLSGTAIEFSFRGRHLTTSLGLARSLQRPNILVQGAYGRLCQFADCRANTGLSKTFGVAPTISC